MLCLAINFTILIFVNWISWFFLNYKTTKFNSREISENMVITTIPPSNKLLTQSEESANVLSTKRTINIIMTGCQGNIELILFPKNLMPQEMLKFKQNKINFFPRDRSLSKLLHSPWRKTFLCTNLWRKIFQPGWIQRG